jgi:hypothetical protein
VATRWSTPSAAAAPEPRPTIVTRESVRDWIRTVERSEPEEQWTVLCFLAGQHIELDPDEQHAVL